METLKNYLEMMFRGLPNTDDVNRAKADLWNMMEDKYDALIKDGKSETEAVGIVIAEFGNLDDIADDLGLGSYVRNEVTVEQPAAEEKDMYRYTDTTKEEEESVLGLISSVFWPTVVAIYLIWSFATFDWGRSWVIWPVAVGVSILLGVFRKIWKEDK